MFSHKFTILTINILKIIKNMKKIHSRRDRTFLISDSVSEKILYERGIFMLKVFFHLVIRNKPILIWI